MVSDPPHGSVNVEAVAAALGLPPEAAAAKIAFPAPEVLKATDSTRARAAAADFRDAGLEVRLVDGAALARAPRGTRVLALDFEDARLRVEHETGTLEVDYATPLLAVSCRPPAAFLSSLVHELASGAARADGEAGEWLPRVDFYVERDGWVERFSVIADLPDETGARAAGREGAVGGELEAVLGECVRRFERLTLDRRLEDVRPRKRFLGGDTGFDHDLRKLYSFGTLLLRHVLEEISPDLRDVTHYDYASRLAYALHRHGRDPVD